MASKQAPLQTSTATQQHAIPPPPPHPHKVVTLTSTPTPPLPKLSRSQAQSPLGRSELVKAEFVFADAICRNARQVTLHGDWSDWTGVMMGEEEKGLWSVVCIVPTGARRFGFEVDGVWCVSGRHPVERDGRANWRVVMGRPDGVEGCAMRTAFYRWAKAVLDDVGVVGGQDGGVGLPFWGGRVGTVERIVRMEWGSIVVGGLAVYLVGAAVWTLLFGG